jgi:5-methylcytosine-specific restriction endonuclease McrA
MDLVNEKRRKYDPTDCQDCGKPLHHFGYRCRACAQALRANIGGSYQQKAARLQVFERDGWTCQLCHEPIDPLLMFPDPLSPSVDHRVPLRDCLDVFGPDFVDDETNWQAAHLVCNTSKGARLAVS